MLLCREPRQTTTGGPLKAIDTNIVVRILTGNDPEQAVRARAVVEAGDVYVPTTVILESFWVLSRRFGFSRAQTAVALRSFATLESVTLDDPDCV
jgi:predicted nucleic-acid-binding protein